MARLWYVATTKTNQEHIAERELRKQGFFPWNPRIRVNALVKTKSGEKNRLCIKPYFPNYIFVRFDATRDRWWPIKSTKGVTGILVKDEIPLPVRKGVIETMMASCGEGFIVDERVEEIIQELHVGDKVRIRSGAFSGKSGIVTKMSSHERIGVLLSIFGRSNEVNVPRSALV